ncbi:MAG: exodeoxyribonuclease VII large subunit, partial [Planctomycetota bacterium]
MMADNSGPLQVSQLCADVKARLEKNFARVPVIGEVTNFSKPSSGHLYFTLRDCSGVESLLAAVMYRSDAAKLRFAPANGQRLVATGNLTIYTQQGRFQLVVKA